MIIITDGFISDECNYDTTLAIIEASNYPLSIITVGVGDGPWDMMYKYNDYLCSKSRFDNFQFVDFNQVLKSSKSPESIFCLKAFMKIPEQFKIMKSLNYFDHPNQPRLLWNTH